MVALNEITSATKLNGKGRHSGVSVRSYNSIPGTVLRHKPKSRQATGVATRVLQRDPIGYAGGVNLYEYVGGRAVVDTDPTGEICGVRFLCRLASSNVDPFNGSVRNCHYLCTEVGYPGDRVDQDVIGGGGVTCASLGKHPLVVTEDKTMYSPWGLWLLHCGNPPPCPANYMWQQWFSSAKPLPACSRAACRAGCSEAEAIGDATCGFFELEKAKKLCEVGWAAWAATCVSTCNAACKNP